MTARETKVPFSLGMLMSWEKHDDTCPGCLPAMLNLATGERMADTSPEMIAAYGVWKKTNLLERQAWHRVMCQNSRTPSDLRVTEAVARRMQQAMQGK